ncbi:hypothetical protein [Lysobacter enzymogenes]|uniref:hypothetical protein n=1 Tax=Lysobacter enzymogenes TaxID=69 RepID=UPI001A96D9FE|nr:hypothetical protein [Lysobacter enzymogenes]QQP96522.1 hypothetical protein JHW38_00240 [Lysobacter enzymogenes]
MTLHAGICKATGKRIYKRYQDAAKVVGRAAHSTNALVPVSFYRCKHCNRWHLTSMTQLEYQVRRIVQEAA